MTELAKREDRPTFRPPMDIAERGDDYEVIIDMPGVDQESVEINLEGNIMMIRGEVKGPDTGELPLLYREYRTGDYEAHLRLSEAVDRENIDAELKNGQLSLKLKKAEQAKPKQIAVRAA